MFEDITFRNNQHRRATKTSHQLIIKYQELKKFTEIYKSLLKKGKTKKKKSQLQRKKILQLIHQELNKRSLLKPEETFEIWHELSDSINKNVAKNVSKKKSSKKGKKGLKDKPETELTGHQGNELLRKKVIDLIEGNEVKEQEEEEQEDEEENKEEEEEDLMTHKLNQFVNNFDSSNRLSKFKFLIESNGLEILPGRNSNNEEDNNINDNDSIEMMIHKSKSAFRQHINNLTTLLHLQMMKKNWSIAYKIFALLIRFPQVDIRTIWPLGIEILMQLDQNKTNFLKVKKFFNYLSSFYMITDNNPATRFISINHNNRSTVAPVWRSGSKTLTPLYVITSLWYIFIQNDYEQVLNKINELILEPPYNSEGVLYFISSLCHLCLGWKLVDTYITGGGGGGDSNEDDERYIVEKQLNIIKNKIQEDFEKCEKYQFIYPKHEIESQFNELMTAVSNKIKENNSTINNNRDTTMNSVSGSSSSEENDLDWDAISSDEDSDNEENKNETLIPTQIDSLYRSNGYNQDKYHSHKKQQPQNHRSNHNDDDDDDDDKNLVEVNFTDDESMDESNHLKIENHKEDDIPASQPLDLDGDMMMMNGHNHDDEEDDDEDNDTQAIESIDSDHEEDRITKTLDSFDTRRNSLELYNKKSSSVEPPTDTLKITSPSKDTASQQTMLDFDFDFDFDSE
ncbi:RNA polymerase I-specific transcription initiation factor, putative [Candida dubliniensis CD36]|uniref:RNA polymerase I-specific transcription initiation factor, putative n=1 Tax=Candida dubliniensis (strain CD36 / ATCC MYA-646 / CBS 7987 / NCPF 3949 / NRRL Y-17841) TaxID=573826 RepID=B9WM54_CANDC|nr:RNA polymerase I-specific transcription initiation factor, putative [Candida dubliniensis CD36]CAX40167.1 RNA polymerase I-specific transcription initiation factor, putative [Candida dubliniensis CD36]